MRSTLPLEKLNGPLVLLCGSQGIERTQIPPLAGLRILFPGIKSKPAGFQFSDHARLFLFRVAISHSSAENSAFGDRGQLLVGGAFFVQSLLQKLGDFRV